MGGLQHIKDWTNLESYDYERTYGDKCSAATDVKRTYGDKCSAATNVKRTYGDKCSAATNVKRKHGDKCSAATNVNRHKMMTLGQEINLVTSPRIEFKRASKVSRTGVQPDRMSLLGLFFK